MTEPRKTLQISPNEEYTMRENLLLPSKNNHSASLRLLSSLAREMMKITPAVTALQDEKTKEKVFQTLYELTANVETIKKQVGKLGKNDDTILL